MDMTSNDAKGEDKVKEEKRKRIYSIEVIGLLDVSLNY